MRSSLHARNRSTARLLLEPLEDRRTPAAIAFSAASAAASEGAGQVVLTVVRTGNVSAAETVDYTTVDGSATDGTRYTAKTDVLSFAANETSKTISISLIDNGSIEFNQVFRVDLSNPTGGATLGTIAQAFVTVRDNDVAVNALTLGQDNKAQSPGNSRQYLAYTPAGELTQLLWFRPSGASSGTIEEYLLYVRLAADGTFEPEMLTSRTISQSSDLNGLFSVSIATPYSLVFDSLGTAHVISAHLDHLERTPLGWEFSPIDNPLESFNSYEIAVAAGPAGSLHLVYQTSVSSGEAIYYGTNQSGSWIFQTIAQVPARRFNVGDFGDLYRALDLAIDGQGRAHVSRSNGYLDLAPPGQPQQRPYSELIYSTNATGTWTHQVVSKPVDDSADAATSASLAIAPGGSIGIVSQFVERAPTGSVGGTSLRYHVLTPGGFTTEIVAASSDNYNASDGNIGTGDYANLEYSPSGRAHIVFTDSAQRHDFGFAEYFTGQLRHAVKTDSGWALETIARQADPVVLNLVYPEVAIAPGGRQIAYAGLILTNLTLTNYIFGFAPLAAEPFLVDSAADVLDSDTSPGHLSLREAIALANAAPGADTIRFADGLGPIDLTLGPLSLTDAGGVTRIIGPASGGQVVRRSGSAASFGVFRVETGALAEFRNLVISNGQTTEPATTGGPDGGLTPTGPGVGGGINNFGTTTVVNSTLQNNSARFGAALRNESGTLTVLNSTLTANQAIDQGEGGGIWNRATLVVVNTTLSGNTAQGRGGGLRDVSSGGVTLTNVTLVANRADADGSGNEAGGGISAAAALTITNSLVAGNLRGTGSTASDIAISTGALSAAASHHNLIGDAASAGGLANGSSGNVVGVNGSGTRPLAEILSPSLAANGGLTLTHALVQNSLAIGGGVTGVPNYSAVDQRGAGRDAAAPDIGAYEVQHPLAPVGGPATYADTFAPRPSSDANAAFVKGLYQSTLLREPDPDGFRGWMAVLAGGASTSQVAYGFVNSVENRSNQVTFYYRYFLSREPDPAGLAGWVRNLQQGADEGNVMSGFLLSPEFTGQYDNADFVNLMYYAILGRQSDPAGFSGWTSQLDSGQSTRDQVGAGFLRSDESITRVVNAFVRSYLKRPPDPAGSATFLAQSRSGVTFGQIAAAILGSPEFYDAAGHNL